MTKRGALTEEDITAWLRNQGLDQVEDYVRRGRQFGGVDADELRRGWVAAYKAGARDLQNVDARKLSDDLEAELSLRGEEPPYSQVKAEHDAVTAAVTAAAEDLLRDPERMREVGSGIVRDMIAFLGGGKGPKAN
jgi:hypothetical protein